MNVLLVEDSPGDVRLTKEAFHEANRSIRLHVASDGVEAMAFLRHEGAYVQAPRPDIILLDLNLPKMDGRTVLTHIKEDDSLKTIPTVILTTSESEADILKSYQLQANCYLTKPVQLEAFETLVRSINDFWLTKVKLPQPPQLFAKSLRTGMPATGDRRPVRGSPLRSTGAKSGTSWLELLADPGKNGHIVQLYQDDRFYVEAVSHFVTEGIARGESIILVPARPHSELISRCLKGKGFDPVELVRRGQLTVLDANDMLTKIMAGNDPDGTLFKPLARQVIAKARAGGTYPRVRWWSEMLNVLYDNGNNRGSLLLEACLDAVGYEESTPIVCSFLMDTFDPGIYEEAFGNVCRTHSHLIPTHDYARHSLTVDRAVAEVVGEIRGPLLESLISWEGAPALMPASQALLLWVREKMPQYFQPVLARARELELGAGRAD